MSGSSETSGRERRSPLGKRRQEPEQEASKRQRNRLESEFLQGKKVITPGDMVVHPALPKVNVATEEDVKVKEEPVDIHEFVQVEVVNNDELGGDCDTVEESVTPGSSAGVITPAAPRPGNTKLIERKLRLIVDEVQDLPQDVQTYESFIANLKEILAPVLSLIEAVPPASEKELGSRSPSSESLENATINVNNDRGVGVVMNSAESVEPSVETEPVDQDKNVAVEANQDERGSGDPILSIVLDSGDDVESSEPEVVEISDSDEVESKEVVDTSESKEVVDKSESEEVVDTSESKEVVDTSESKEVVDASESKEVAKDVVVKSWNPVTKHLVIFVLKYQGSKIEKTVLSRFNDVTELTVYRFDSTKGHKNNIVVPGFFETLKVFKIWAAPKGGVGHYLKACLPRCKNLEKITLPSKVGVSGADSWLMSDIFASLSEHVSSENSRMTEIDFSLVNEKDQWGHFTDDREEFQKLFRACAEQGVKICNPCTKWPVGEYDSHNQLLLSRCIKSFTMDSNSLSDYILLPNLEQLESLTIHSVGNWLKHLRHALNANGHPEKWTRLTTLDVEFDTKGFMWQHLPWKKPFFCEFLVEQSPNLVELGVNYCGVDHTTRLLTPHLLSQLRLRKLTLSKIKIPQENDYFEKAWGVLCLLEELTLNDCFQKSISKQDWYVSENSTFLQLRNLRKLWLLNTDEIFDTRDQFLRNVLPKMQLTHLVITCMKPIDYINLIPKAGLESLMKGRCGQSIQELLVDGLSLKHLFPGTDASVA